ncbi:hypothetical protein CCO03_16315 [Comamonas serinivorans]|uniref:DUF3293 domain-containing protein n=1 Tax=Comamonas serinivorans TaxID=1082851 RepID=A0A1Y0ERZ1_9BURK|nr:DUF3293 domain-containing protein [Comamonas serinivorans]ARU06022.1 hypothetical protein CCO03_16315 [Comamonas serinivorans]
MPSHPARDLDASTHQAFLDTDYHVHGDPPFTLRVNEASAALLALHARAGVRCSAFVTACNPQSTPLDEATNAARQADLADELTRRGLAFIPGVGQHPSNPWPGEASFLILGLDPAEAGALGAQLGQHAILWSGADAVPQLVLLP